MAFLPGRGGGGGDFVQVALPGEGATSLASAIFFGQAASVKFDDGATETWHTQVRVPAGATGIASIEIIYHNQSGNGSNVVLDIGTERYRPGVSSVSDTSQQTNVEYTTSNTVQTEAFTVEAAAYDGLGTLQEGDIIGFNLSRVAGALADTYNANWNVLGIRFTFN